MSDEANFTITLKAGAGYDAPWLVVRGDTADQLAKNLRDFFGITADQGMTAHETFIHANAALQGAQTMTSKLGGKPVESDGGQEVKAAVAQAVRDAEADKPKPQGDGESEAEARVRAELAKCNTKEEMQAVWGANRKAFKEHPELNVAFKARSTELGIS